MPLFCGAARRRLSLATPPADQTPVTTLIPETSRDTGDTPGRSPNLLRFFEIAADAVNVHGTLLRNLHAL